MEVNGSIGKVIIIQIILPFLKNPFNNQICRIAQSLVAALPTVMAGRALRRVPILIIIVKIMMLKARKRKQVS